jgi:hypothetical protein
MVFGALMLLVVGAGVIAAIFMALLLFDILGTGFAAYMLESWLIIGAMAIGAAGWLLRITGGRRTAL